MNDSTTDDVETLHSILQLLVHLPVDRRVKILQTLESFLGHADQLSPIASAVRRPVLSNPGVKFSDSGEVTPKEFLLAKQPKTDVERIACLAFYLTHYRDVPYFKTIDLSRLNTEAAQPRLSNANYATKNAVTYGYLAQAVKGQRQLSAAGEQFVSALPDREQARNVMTQYKKKPRAKRKVSLKKARVR